MSARYNVEVVSAAAIESLIASPQRTQRQALELLETSWRAGLEQLDDEALLSCLRVIRTRINSKKLVSRRDALLGALRRDGLGGSAALPKPSPPPAPPVDMPATPFMVPVDPAANQRLRFELEIGARPEHNAAYAVYRDWLESQGQVVDGKLPLGPLAEAEDMLTQVEWKLGFVRRARLRYSYERFNDELPELSIEQALAALLDDPGPGRVLEHLIIGLARHDDNDYAGVCEVIGRRARPTLRRLEIGDFEVEECELNWTTINATLPMWPALAHLQSLVLRAGAMVLDGLELPELREFETITGGMDAAALGIIGRAQWPKLERLAVQIGHSHEGAATELEPLLPLLMEPERSPKLVHLGVTNCEFADELCEALVRAPLLPQLRTLDLSMSTMSMAGVQTLLRNKERFAHIEMINLDDNYLPDAARWELLGLGVRFEFGSQREEYDGRRYASAYE